MDDLLPAKKSSCEARAMSVFRNSVNKTKAPFKGVTDGERLERVSI
jgi:hypothetical protein